MVKRVVPRTGGFEIFKVFNTLTWINSHQLSTGGKYWTVVILEVDEPRDHQLVKHVSVMASWWLRDGFVACPQHNRTCCQRFGHFSITTRTDTYTLETIYSRIRGDRHFFFLYKNISFKNIGAKIGEIIIQIYPKTGILLGTFCFCAGAKLMKNKIQWIKIACLKWTSFYRCKVY